jgi:AcrR family transcriptional regulator
VQRGILAAALEAFCERGFHGATMRQIASLAGVTPANVYNYFAAKDDLLLEILRRASADQLAAVEAAVDAAAGDVRSRFEAAVYAYVLFEAERRDECLVSSSELRYLGPAHRARIVACRDREQEIFERLVARGVADGVFATPHPDEACLAILTMASGVPLWYRPDGPLSPDDVARRHARYALALVEGTPDAHAPTERGA